MVVDLIISYYNFISRPLPTDPGPTGLEVMPNIVVDTIFYSLFFTAINLLIPVLLKLFYSNWYYSLEKRKQFEIASYIACLFHHFLMVPRGWVHIYNDYLLSAVQSKTIHYAMIESSIAPFSIGYLIGDTITYAIPEAIRGKYEYIIHHILTLALVISSLSAPGNIARFIPHLLICDTPNVFFNVAWVLRAMGYKGSSFVTFCEINFAIWFLIARVINLSLVFFVMGTNDLVVSMGYARFGLFPIAFLQWYWFALIAKTLISRVTISKDTNSNSSSSISNSEYKRK